MLREELRMRRRPSRAFCSRLGPRPSIALIFEEQLDVKRPIIAFKPSWKHYLVDTQSGCHFSISFERTKHHHVIRLADTNSAAFSVLGRVS